MMLIITLWLRASLWLLAVMIVCLLAGHAIDLVLLRRQRRRELRERLEWLVRTDTSARG